MISTNYWNPIALIHKIPMLVVRVFLFCFLGSTNISVTTFGAGPIAFIYVVILRFLNSNIGLPDVN